MIPNDPLKDRLQTEAEIERPAFSADLHHQLMSQIRNQPSAMQPTPRLLAYAAALLLIASATIAIAWHATRPAQPPAQLTNARPQPTAQPPRSLFPPNTLFALHIGDILAAQLWPPRMTVSLPLPASSPEPQPPATNEPTALPQWMVSTIEAAPQAETRALLNVVPDDLKSLVHPFAARLLANSSTSP